MADLLAEWWVHPTTIERLTGHGAEGDAWDTPEAEVLGFVETKVRLVRDMNGDEVVSSATIFYPPGTPLIPSGSYITVPAVFGGFRSRVIFCAVHDGGGQDTPDHVEVMVE